MRAEPTHLAGERLNHSAKASLDLDASPSYAFPSTKAPTLLHQKLAERGFDPLTFGL